MPRTSAAVIDMHLSSATATALAAALVAAAAALAFSYLPGLFVWAAFIGWASYDHSGAKARAAARSSAALVFGVVMAWIVAMVAVAAGGTPIVTALSAGAASFLIVAASRLSYLSVVPATFYGFASTFAYLSLAPGAFTLAALTALSLRNILVALPVSLLLGTGLGIAHGRLANALAGGAAATPARRALSLTGSPR